MGSSILDEIDDVEPLISKSVKIKSFHCSVNNVILFALTLVNLFGSKCIQIWHLLLIGICHVLGWGVDALSGLKKIRWHYLGKVGRLFHKSKRKVDVSLRHHRLRAHESVSANGDNVELGQQTLTKDFGIGTHAGSLYPNGTSEEGEGSNSENDEIVFKFSNWVGSYSAYELAKMQSDDSDIGCLLQWKQQFTERPCRDKVAAESPAVRSLWLQWPQLFVRNGVLFRKWTSADSSLCYDQLVLPSILHFAQGSVTINAQ